ncbi:MAG: polyphosphate kinase, partial [Pseudomonadota bacterium]|nr:polyphosphate kinase [Pseudomonadota bacterium]
MFEIAETGQKIDKETYEALLPNLRSDLVAMQQRLRGANFPVLIVYAGVNGAGKVMTMNLMSETLDPRWILSRAYDEPSDEERARPEYWRFWRDLPPHGAIGQYLRSWYSRPLLDHVYGRTHDADFDASLARARAFEKVLADDGALILKYWMHLSEKAQKKRLTALESDPHESWRVSEIDWQHWRMYDRFIASAERLITSTDTEYAPWRIIEGADARYRSATVMTSLLNSVNRHIDQRDARKKTRYVPVAPTAKAPVILQKLRHDLTLNKPDYSESLQHRWARLNPLTREATKKGISVIMV